MWWIWSAVAAVAVAVAYEFSRKDENSPPENVNNSTSSVANRPTPSSTSAKKFHHEKTHSELIFESKRNISSEGTTRRDASRRTLEKSHEPVIIIHQKPTSYSQKPADLCSKIAPTYDSQLKQTSSRMDKASLQEKLPPRSIKPTISLASSKPASNDGKRVDYILDEEGASPTYLCPDDLRILIEKGIVPGVLKNPLSMSTYEEYFQALLYAEDIYLEKWDGFEMKNVNLLLQEAAIHTRKSKSKTLNDIKSVEKTFVAFEMDKIPEKRPFLLSRDFVTVRPLSKNQTYQGIVYRVVKSNLVLAEFEEDFHSQHIPYGAYDVKFSFNRVCLKRAHQAVLNASDDLFRNFLFPNFVARTKLNPAEPSIIDHRVGVQDAYALQQILTLRGSGPSLLEGELSLTGRDQLSKTGVFVVEAVIRIRRASSSNRILLCAPTNRTCDMLMRGLKKEIPESDMFRANAAFRELDGVPLDILPSCLYETERECFSCHSLEELFKFRVILSTFMSSFRLHSQGIMAGHFSHIFLVDASSVTEPEALVPLANFANKKTSVIITGEPGNRSSWIRSAIARENGLRVSYFERLRGSIKLSENWENEYHRKL